MSYFRSESHTIYYHEAGVAKGGIPLLFIHGLGSSTKDWEYQLEYFSASHRVISIDLRGHGHSPPSKGSYSIFMFAEDVASLLRYLDVKAHIIGISMGGMIAFQLALDFADLVESITVINCGVALPMDNPEVRKAIRFRKWIPRLMGMKMMGKMIGKKLFPHPDQAPLRCIVASRWAKNSVKNYIKCVDALAGWTIEDRLHQIKCKTLIIGGERDYTPVVEKQSYQLKILYSVLKIVPQAGHAVTIEKPEVLNQLISEFIENNFL